MFFLGWLFCHGDRSGHDFPARPSAPHPQVDVAANARQSRNLVALRHVEPALQSALKRCNVIVTPLGTLLQFSRHSRTNLCSTTHQNGLCKKNMQHFLYNYFIISFFSWKSLIFLLTKNVIVFFCRNYSNVWFLISALEPSGLGERRRPPETKRLEQLLQLLIRWTITLFVSE